MRASGPKVLYDPDWGGLLGSQYQHLRRCFTVRSFPCRSPKPVPEFTDKYVWVFFFSILFIPYLIHFTESTAQKPPLRGERKDHVSCDLAHAHV